MRIVFFRLGDKVPKGFEEAVGMLNKSQTIWKLVSQPPLPKPDSFDPNDNLSCFPSGNDSNFNIGITTGRIDHEGKLSSQDFFEHKALIAEWDWQQLENYDPHEAFWAFAIANVCFQVSINSCSDEYCLGYKSHSVDKLLLKLLSLHICGECANKMLAKHKYRIPEIMNLVEIIRKPHEYSMVSTMEEPFLPTLDMQIRRFKGEPIFQDCGIITIMHFLENLVSFVKGLMSLGAKKEAIAIIVKPYPYSHRPGVHAYLQEKYPGLRIEYLDELPPSDQLLEELAEYCQANSRSGKILVIEDGGYLVPFLHRNYTKSQNFCIGAVEQTTRGIKKDKALEEVLSKKTERLYFPVINVAKSNFKEVYEAPLVGRSVVYTIQKLLSERHFAGQPALVVGFGAVGKEVANALQQIGMVPRVYDNKLEQLASAKVRGFIASNDLSKLVEGTKLIVGSTGEKSISKDILDNIEDDTILVSASSDRIEIDIEYLALRSQATEFDPKIGTYYKKKKERSEDRYLLLADGFPINFYFGSGIPTRSIDPVLSQLFIGAAHLARNLVAEPGISNIMNDLISEYKLLEDFIATYSD